MKIHQKTIILLFLLSTGILVAYVSSCKKLDLKRIAIVETGSVSNITSNSAVVEGNIIDLGESPVDYGFCYKSGGLPTINDSKVSGGSNTNTGTYELNITSLQENTNYSIRSYIINSDSVTYGEPKNFKTLQAISGEWLHFDDGVNYDGIGFTEGGSFDVAIRFQKEDLVQYAGTSVTKVKFFPREHGVDYYATVWEGNDPPELILFEEVPNPIINGWTEYTLSLPHAIKTNKDLWVGYWIVDHPADTYPAGVDDGPALTGEGDLISSDGGLTWESLSMIDPPNLDYNWNIQAYVENAKGEVLKLDKIQVQRETKTSFVAERNRETKPQLQSNKQVN